MAFTKEEAVAKARKDLAVRLGVSEADIEEASIEDSEFPDMALGAAAKGEMAGQMITPGWRITLKAKDWVFEYRANKHQVRLYNYKGENYHI